MFVFEKRVRKSLRKACVESIEVYLALGAVSLFVKP
jgi:hypothetical protein